MDESQIFRIERPSPKLLKLYILRSLLSGPFCIITFPLLIFRYITLKYRFDSEGISVKWGLLFRKEVNLTYARIQDIHLSSGVIQRWFGLADLKIQTASGSAEPEMVLEGICEYEMLRDFLYTKMRGYRKNSAKSAPDGLSANSAKRSCSDEHLKFLSEITADIKAAREALEKIAEKQ